MGSGSEFTDDMALSEARRLVMERAFESVSKGVTCPCCDGLVKIYRRKIHKEMCQWLWGLAKLANRVDRYYTTEEIVDVTKHLKSWGTDGVRLLYWGLIDKRGQRNLAGSPSGSYRILSAGREFLRGKRSVAAYVDVFRGEVISMSEEKVFVHESFETRFEYDEMMKGL